MIASPLPDRMPRAVLPGTVKREPARVPAPPTGAIWPLVVVACACFVPREISFDVATATFYPYRFALLVMAPLTLRELYRRPVEINVVDFIVVFTALWHWIALMVTATVRDALITGFGQAMDFALAYATGRAYVRSLAELRQFAKLLTIPALLATSTMVLEVIAGKPLIHPILNASLGRVSEGLAVDEYRMGILRATGPFPHPILGGTLLAALLPLLVFGPKEKAWKTAGLIAASGFVVTVSSTSYAAFFTVAILIAILFVQEITRIRALRLAMFFAILAAIFLETANSTGISGVLTRFALDPGSVYYRDLIWQYAGADALAHPLFGIGTRQWARPFWMGESIDAHGLMLAVKFGLPAALGTAAIILLSAYSAPRHIAGMTRSDARAAYSISFALVATFVASFMVAFWDGPLYLPLILAGIGVSLGSARTTAAAAPAALSIQSDPIAPPPSAEPAPGRMGRAHLPFRRATR